jgi:glycosyltransferase involved in cell wall biosynthesis
MTDRKLRVAMLAQHFAEYASLLALGLAESCDVLLVLNAENAKNELGVDWEKRFNHGSLRILPLPKARTIGMVWSNYRQARRAIKQFDPEVIHCQEGVWDELILLLIEWRACPLVLTVHDPVPHTGRDARNFRFSRHRAYQKLLRWLCAAAITHGNALCDSLVKVERRLNGRTFSVPHGVLGPVDLEFDTAWTQGELLFFGRIHAYKGLGYFIAAVNILAERGLPVQGVIAGKGTDLDNYRDAISNSPLFDVRDRFIPLSEMDELFKRANAVVLPYTDGTQSGVAALGLGYGRPIIATRVGSIPDLVRDGVNGLLVSPCSPTELADAIERVIRDQEFAASLAKNSFIMGHGELSWQEIAMRTINVYKHVIGKRQA